MKNKKALISFGLPVLSLLLALAIGAIIIIALGKNPIQAYGNLLTGSFGSLNKISETILKATPLIFCGLAATFAYRCGVINLGGEGQFVMGSIVALVVSNNVLHLNNPWGVIVTALFATLAGALWGMIPAALKAYRGLNEMIVTIMMNYVAVLFMEFLYSGPLLEGIIPQTAAVGENARLPVLVPGTKIHLGIVIALLVAGMMYYFLFYTSKGVQLRAVGQNPIAAKVNGMNVKTFIFISFCISGAIAGLGGAMELHGAQFRLMGGYGKGYGFDGIAIALIGQLNPIGTVLVGYLFAVLRTGAVTMQVGSGIPTPVVDIIQALIIIFVVAGTALIRLPSLNQYLTRRAAGRKEKEEAA